MLKSQRICVCTGDTLRVLEERNASAETVRWRTARARETEKTRNDETIDTMERERSVMTDKANNLLTEMKYWREAASSLADTGVRTCATARTLPEHNPSTDYHYKRERSHGYLYEGPSLRQSRCGSSLSSPSELSASSYINNTKGDVLVSRELLTSLLRLSKVKKSRCFHYSPKLDAFYRVPYFISNACIQFFNAYTLLQLALSFACVPSLWCALQYFLLFIPKGCHAELEEVFSGRS